MFSCALQLPQVAAYEQVSGANNVCGKENLYIIAGGHLLTAAVAFALESAGIYDAVFMQVKAKTIRKVTLMDAEMASIFSKE